MAVVLLAVVLGVVAAAIGVAAVAGGRRSLPLAAGIGVVAVLAVVAIGGMVGVSTDRGEEPDRAPSDAGDDRDDRPTSVFAPTRPVDLHLDARRSTARPFPPLLPLVDGLPDVSTRLVLVRDAGSVTLHQCVVEDGVVRRCGAGVPTLQRPLVGGDGDGATGLVEIRRRLDIGDGVDCERARCVLAAVDDEGMVALLAELGFDEPRPTAALAVEPARGVEPGDRVVALVGGAPPRTRVTLRWCAAPGPTEPGACDGATDAVVVETDASGRARAATALPDRPVGDGRECTPRSPCAVILEVDGGRPVAQAVVTLAGLAGPDLSRQQLAGGLAAALLLAAVAVLIHRRTDWRGPDGDVFEGVSLSVPEWEGVSLEVPEWDEVVPLGSGAAPGGAG